MKILSSSGKGTIVPVLSAFFFALFLSLLFSLTTGLSCVTILATASCTVGSNVYDADSDVRKALFTFVVYTNKGYSDFFTTISSNVAI